MAWLSCILSNVVLASLLALTAWFVQRSLRLSAVARVLWVLVLVKLVTPPLLHVPLVELPGTMACALGVCNCGHEGSTQTIVRDTILWALATVWLVGAGAMGWTAWRRWIQFQRLLTHAREASPEWQSLAAHLSSELSIRCPQILEMPGRLPPLVVMGWCRPRLLLPIALMGQLNESQRAPLMLHELTHIKRGDHLVRILELIVSVTFWWLPLVGSIGRQLRVCEETCCDAAVVAHLPQARRDYARLLLDVLDFANPLPLQSLPQATAMSAAHDLEVRLRSILDTKQNTRRTWPGAVLAMGLALAMLPCGLHYELASRDLARQPSPMATFEGCEPTTNKVRSSRNERKAEVLSLYQCPSR